MADHLAEELWRYPGGRQAKGTLCTGCIEKIQLLHRFPCRDRYYPDQECSFHSWTQSYNCDMVTKRSLWVCKESLTLYTEALSLFFKPMLKEEPLFRTCTLINTCIQKYPPEVRISPTVVDQRLWLHYSIANTTSFTNPHTKEENRWHKSNIPGANHDTRPFQTRTRKLTNIPSRRG